MKSIAKRLVTLFATALTIGCGSNNPPVRPTPLSSRSGEPVAQSQTQKNAIVQGQYASVNGLKMYYEIHGANTGANKPLVTLHGAFGVATIPEPLATGRQIIAVELQGHGHTADIDRPLTFEQMADDTAALLEQLKIDQVDLFGYSMGGNVALAMAIRYPNLVRKLAINGSNHGPIDKAYEEQSLKQFQNMPIEFAPNILKDPYDKVAPDPSRWPVLVSKVKMMGLEFKGFDDEALRSIKSPLLITLGDRDVVRVEHAVELFRLVRHSQLAVFPGGDHFMMWQSPERLLPTIVSFFDAPLHGGFGMQPQPN